MDELIEKGEVDVWDIEVPSKCFDLYLHMVYEAARQIGKGEASALALAVEHDGIVASNNLRDIMDYVRQYDLAHVTTAGVLVEAYESGIIDEQEGNSIWANMRQHGRLLGADSFGDYMNKMPRNPF